VTQARRGEIEALIRRETALLNAADLEAWSRLFTDDGYYWAPLEPEHEDPEAHDSLIYDNRALMEMRRRNFAHPLSPSMQVPVRSLRIVADVEIEPVARANGDVAARGTVMATIHHRETTHYAGRALYLLRDGPEGLKIRVKRVDLLNADAPLGVIMMYI